jgi:hypothetical protein
MTITQHKDMTIEEFCAKHHACNDGQDWATRNCTSMHDAWQKLKPEWLIWVATRPGVFTDRELRLFACWSVRQVWHLLTDERSRNAIVVAEKFADGDATREELSAARDAAWDAAWDAASAARAAASAAAWDAAWDAARAARDAASAAAWDAAWDAIRADQVKYLRENYTPNFSEA